MNLIEAAQLIQQFEQDSLTARIQNVEASVEGANLAQIENIYPAFAVTPELLPAALTLKQTASQVNVIIHAVGILVSLPHILRPGEKVEALSLGAGNTGKLFDLETSERVAEFKFINWRGGSESIRQNSLFKDFYLLAEHESAKERYLYVVGLKYPMKFLGGGRSLKSVMSRHNKLWEDFQARYGTRFTRVREYYQYRQDVVEVVDLAQVVPQLRNIAG